MATCSSSYSMPPGTVRLVIDGELQTALIKHPIPTNDPNDPLNWSRLRKMLNFIPVLAVSAIIFTQASVASTFWQLWITDFNCTYSQLTTSLAINYTGTATGCIFFIPIAIKYGRRPVYIVSLGILVAAAAWQARMTSILELYISSLFVGFAGATNETLVQMTVADLFFVHQRGTANGAYVTMVLLGSFLSPMIAGYIADASGWRSSYWAIFAVEAVSFAYFCLIYEESKYVPLVTPSIPENTESEGKPTSTTVENHPSTPDSQNGSPIDPTIPDLKWRQRVRFTTPTNESLLRTAYIPFVVLWHFPAVLFTGIQYSVGLAWVSAQAAIISIVFASPPYGFGVAGIGNMSIPIFLGCILGALYSGILSDRVMLWLARRNDGYYEPEMRLHMLALPSIAAGGGLAMFGVTAAKGMHWIYPSIGSSIFGFGAGAIFNTVMCVLIDSYEVITAEAFVAIAFMRNILSIGMYFVINPWLEDQGLQNMFIVMGVLASIVSFLYVPLLIWGKRVREKTAPRYLRFVDERKNSRL